jgi:hypothetical protein
MLHILYTSMKQYSSYIIQLMTLDEVNTMIYQRQRCDYHREFLTWFQMIQNTNVQFVSLSDLQYISNKFPHDTLG